MTGEQTPRRRTWLRVLSFLIAIVVLGAHIITFGVSKHHPPWLSLELRDLFAHIAMFLAFALVYRYSYTRAASPLSANVATVLVCSGWGALCEFIQIWLPRDFNPFELLANIGAPLLVAALFHVLERR